MFEKNGLLFEVSFLVNDGKPWLSIIGFNQNDGIANVRGSVRYKYAGPFGVNSETINWNFDIDKNGQFEKLEKCRLDSCLAGNVVELAVNCSVKYPSGKNIGSSPKTGIKVDGIGMSWMDLLALPLLFFGVALFRRDAKCTVMIPNVDWENHDDLPI